MADFVEIISENEIKKITQANAELGKLLKTLNVTVNTANKLNFNSRGSSGNNTPSQSNTNTTANNTAIERNIRLVERQRVAEIRLQQQREQAFDRYERQIARETANLERSNSVYNKIQAKVSQLTASYNNLAAKKELGLRLTDRETAQLSTLESRLQRYQTVLSRVDQNIGNYRRNVGNYASGFNPLNNAIGQIAREVPNAAQSFQIFAMSIGNNIGALQDSINQLRARNRELVATGQPVRSVFSQVLGSILSLNTLLYVGIALFIAYNKQISSFVSNLFSSKDAMDANKIAAEQLNNIRKEGIKSSTDERIELQNNLSIAKNVALSYRDREIAAKKVLDQYPYWFESLGKEAILNGNVQKAVEGVNRALLARALANAAITKITENQSKVIDLREKELVLQKQISSLQKEITNNEKIQQRTVGGGTVAGTYNLSASASLRLSIAQKRLAGTQQEINALNETNNRLLSYSAQQAEKAIGLSYQTEKAKKAEGEATKQAETNSKVSFERNIAIFEERLSLMNKENIMYGILQLKLNLIKGAYEALYGTQEELNDETERTINFGTVEYYNDVISKLKQEQEQVANNVEAYRLYSNLIRNIEDLREGLTGGNTNSESDLNRQLTKLKEEQSQLPTTTAEWKKYSDQIKEVQKSIDDLTGKTQERIDSYLKTFSEGLFSGNGMGTLFKALNDEITGFGDNWAVTFNALSEIAQETFNFLNKNSQAYFNARYANLEREKDLALQFAGESESGRAEIERQYDERRRAIRRQELQQEKEAAIFNAVIDTAQGVVASLAKGGPAGIALAAVIAGLGAAQIALISSQPIPAYKHGTDNHKGGLALVGDGGKHEVVYQPTAGWSITPNKNTLVNLEKGSKVFPDIASSGLFNSNFPDMIALNGGGLNERQMDNIMRKYSKPKTVAPQVHVHNHNVDGLMNVMRSKPGKVR